MHKHKKESAVGKKIAKLRREGKPAKQAAAIAYDMARRGDLPKRKQKFGELANGYAPK